MKRMRTRGILLGSILICSMFNKVVAQNYEQVYMKNGSVIEGYICEQVPGKTISLSSVKATVVVNSDSLQSSSARQVNINELSSVWQSWVKKQPNTNGETVKLSTLKFVATVYKDVYVIEEGALMKFVDLSPQIYMFGWNEIFKTIKTLRPNNQYSGIEDVLVLQNGTQYAGQITEQYPGKNLKIQTNENNIVTVNTSQVVQIDSNPFNSKQDLFQQTPLLDKVYMEGQNAPIIGFITKRVTNKDLTIQMQNGEAKVIPLKQILKYQKVPNDNYTAICDRELTDGEILLNGENAWFAPLEVNGSYIILGEDVSAQVAVGDTITIEAKFSNTANSVSMVKAYRKNIDESEKKAKEAVERDVFTYQDLVERSLPFSRTMSPLGNTRIQFQVKSPGDYALSVQGKKGYIVINVIDKNK